MEYAHNIDILPSPLDSGKQILIPDQSFNDVGHYDNEDISRGEMQYKLTKGSQKNIDFDLIITKLQTSQPLTQDETNFLDRLQSITWGEVIWWLKLAGWTALGAGVFNCYAVAVLIVVVNFVSMIHNKTCSCLDFPVGVFVVAYSVWFFGSIVSFCTKLWRSIFGCCNDHISSFRENEESRRDRIERKADSRHLKRLQREENHRRKERIVQEQKAERQKVKERLREEMNAERIQRLQTQTQSNAIRKEQMTDLPEQASGFDNTIDITTKIDIVDERPKHNFCDRPLPQPSAPMMEMANNHYPQITEHGDRQMYPGNSLRYFKDVCI
jgi:hypothetical protein